MVAEVWFSSANTTKNQWEFQDPKMEVLYQIRPYFGGIYIALQKPYIGLIYGRYLQFGFLEWPLEYVCLNIVDPTI